MSESMDLLHYVVPGRPVTWARTNEVNGRRVTDKAQKAAKKAHQWAAVGAGMHQRYWPLEGAFSIDVIAYYSSAVVGDSDRLVSLAMDALQCPKRCKAGCGGICWHDDRQVRDERGRIIADGSPERVEVTVRRLAVDPVQSAAARKRAGKR